MWNAFLRLDVSLSSLTQFFQFGLTLDWLLSGPKMASKSTWDSPLHENFVFTSGLLNRNSLKLAGSDRPHFIVRNVDV